MATAILSREQRDGLHEFVSSHLQADELGHLVKAKTKNPDAVKALVASLPVCIRLLDQLGWQEVGEAASYEVLLDSEVHRLLPELASRIEGTIQDDEREVSDGSGSFDARRFLRHDRHALDAVTLMRAVA